MQQGREKISKMTNAKLKLVVHKITLKRNRKSVEINWFQQYLLYWLKTWILLHLGGNFAVFTESGDDDIFYHVHRQLKMTSHTPGAKITNYGGRARNNLNMKISDTKNWPENSVLNEWKCIIVSFKCQGKTVDFR